MTYTYKIGDYVQLEFFYSLIGENNGSLLIYCDQTINKNVACKYSGVWYMYAYSAETDKWHPLVKVEAHTKRMTKKAFTSAEGIINSIIRFNLPISAITSAKGSGCEISNDGSFYYRPQCIFI